MMNMTPFIVQSSDRFSAANTVCTAGAGSDGRLINLRYRSSEDGDAILLDLQYSGSGNQPHLEKGKLFMLINGTKRYSFVPHFNQLASAREYYDYFDNKKISWSETVYYEISEVILREMAYASSLEFKVTGSSLEREIVDEGDRPSFIVIAKALYSAVFDNSLFVEELKKEELRLNGAKSEAELIEREWKELEERCKRHNSRMGQFIGKGCSWDTEESKFIERFGKDPKELYDHLEFAIPLFDSLLSHMHEYNIKYPKTKVEINYIKEEKVRTFVEVLKRSKEKVNSCMVAKRTKMKTTIIIMAIILFMVIVVLVLF